MARDGGLGHVRAGVARPDPACLQHMQRGPHARSSCRRCTPSAAHFLKSHQLLVQKFAADRSAKKAVSPFRSRAAWSAREIESQVLATLAALAQISTPSAAHFLKSHQLLVQKFAADRDRQKKPRLPFDRAQKFAADRDRQKKPRLPFDRDCPAHTLQRSQARSQRFQTWNGAIGLRDNNSPVLPFDRSTKTRTDASVTIRLLISTPTQRVSHI
jgi:hypothetical protein